MSLYLKYRPLTFNDTVNQKHIIDILKMQVQKGECMNNYLFFGPRGTGKTTTARILARSINCQNPTDGNPCNQCQSCKSILNGATLDFVEIDAASHTQVENIREEIIEKSIYPPSALKKKVYIIDEVHMLSKAAFNALLKIMEEPPSYLVFILATTEINKIPETIVSRSLVFNFKKLTHEDIIGRLEYIAQTEGISYNINALGLIAKVCDGAMRDAIKYLEQVSIMGEINEENVSKFLGVAPDKLIEEFLEKLKNKQPEAIYEFLNDLQIKGIDLGLFAKETLMYIDRNFMNDMEYFSSISDLIKNILINIKSFPLPLIIFKSEIYKYISNIGQPTQTINTKKPVINQEKPSKPIINQTLTNDKPQIVKSQESGNSIGNHDSQNFENILNLAAEACESKVTIKTALKRYVHINSISEGIISLVVINQLQYSSLTKPENIQFLEKVFTEILGNETKVHVEYLSKEDYLNKQLDF